MCRRRHTPIGRGISGALPWLWRHLRSTHGRCARLPRPRTALRSLLRANRRAARSRFPRNGGWVVRCSLRLLRTSIPTRSIKTRSRELSAWEWDVLRRASMSKNELFLGVDGGGTRCRARLCDASGLKLAQAEAGPANIRLGLKEAFASVLDVTL